MAASAAVPERQRDFGEIEAAEAPAGSVAEAACPGGAAAKQRGLKDGVPSPAQERKEPPEKAAFEWKCG